ncbi:MAG: hypothetical protein V3T70_03235, partial [Phycisphaerae bacterium]
MGAQRRGTRRANFANFRRLNEARDLITDFDTEARPVLTAATSDFADRQGSIQSDLNLAFFGGSPGQPVGKPGIGRSINGDPGAGNPFGEGGLYGDLARIEGDFSGDLSTLSGELTSKGEALRTRVLADIARSGDQERRDINTGFGNLQASNQADLTSRGLSGTTILSGTRGGIERRRADAQGGLEERLRQQRVSADTALTDRILGARERTETARIGGTATLGVGRVGTAADFATILSGAGQNTSNAKLKADLAGLGLSEDTMNRLLNLTVGVQNNAPSQSTFLTASGQGGAGSVQGPSAPSSSGFGPFLPGAGAAFGTLTAKAVIQLCIDGDAELETLDGNVSMASVKIGDMIRSVDGEFKTVVDTDYGAPDPSRNDDYLLIVTDKNELVVTNDHIVAGRPAGEWSVGDAINGGTIRSVGPTPAVPSGDIAFADGTGY